VTVLAPERAYGWKPSPIDPRHVQTNVSAGARALALPEYDPRGQADAPSVVDQLRLGSCTANAFRTALRRALMLAELDTGEDLSRLHIYGGERTMEGTFSEDAGAIGHDAFRFARRHGIACEQEWPYGDGETFASESDYLRAQDASGKVFIRAYSHPHPDQATFKAVLSRGKYICFGFTVYESFESQAVAKTGIVPLPRAGERMLGGHEVAIIGYQLYEGRFYFICQNSWGAEWGQEGFFLMPEAYALGYGSGDWRCIDLV
jgi:C1A family cysteine protease